MFFNGSRYAKPEVLEHVDASGQTHPYKAIRLIPNARTDTGHRVAAGERLDHIAQRYLHDPERFWRIADANLALWPDDLTAEPGSILRVPDAQE